MLVKKLNHLPVHHIDACIVTELLLDQEEKIPCKRYLNKVGYNYQGKISFNVLGEITKNLLIEIDESWIKEQAFIMLDDLIYKRRIDFYSPQCTAFNIALEINRLDTRIEPADALHVACAIEDKANAFVTIDTTLLRSKKIKEKFGLKIKHPMDY